MIDDEVLLTLDECLALVARASALLEHSALERVAAECVAAGFPDADVKHVVEEHARWLCESRPARLATAKQMLEHRCTAVH